MILGLPQNISGFTAFIGVNLRVSAVKREYLGAYHAAVERLMMYNVVFKAQAQAA